MFRTLSVLTWNVWFDRLAFELRAHAIFAVCRQRQPDVICFQEVLPQFCRLLLAQDWTAGYVCSCPKDGGTLAPYGVLMLVKRNLNPTFVVHPLPTQMSRSLLLTTIKAGDTTVGVGTVHLESLDSAPCRRSQLESCAQKLAAEGPAVLCGDFNFDSRRNYSGKGPLENDVLTEVLPDFVDVWPSLMGRVSGFTFDSDQNPMLRRSERMRYDRIMLRGGRPLSIERLGTATLADPVYGFNAELLEKTSDSVPSTCLPCLCPSDHFGLLCSFTITDAVPLSVS
jgi:tyrosyl-DNA phosphodiesterase 2